MPRSCPDCNEDLVEVEAGGKNVGWTCYNCDVLWYGVTGVDVRFSHPDTDRMAEDLKVVQ